MQKWEYRFEDADANKLNVLGAQGWEAIGARAKIETTGKSGEYYGDVRTSGSVVLLKRPIQ
jgi:hypothetical protein